MDSYYFFEEELITKMHTSLAQRFNLDTGTAAELVLEFIEVLKASNSNLSDVKSLYFH